MGVIEKIIVSDATLKQLEEDARLHGRTVAEEVASRIDTPVREETRDQLIARMRAFRDSLPPQKTDSLTLLREDRAGHRH